MGAAAPVDEAVAEIDCGVVDDLRFLVGEEFLVTAMRRDEALSHGEFLYGIGLKRLIEHPAQIEQR
jgi:hypothetical protein